jgi:hypothetical protein
MKEYKIAESSTSTQLEKLVNDLLDNNWELYGSISITSVGGSVRIWQPMIREKIEE